MAERAKTPLHYFNTLTIRHKATNRLLVSIGKNYPWEGSSTSQQIVGTSQRKSDNTTWRIKPSHNRNFTKKLSDTVADKDLVRLEHVKTRKNLHSHAGIKSHSSKQQEVTAYGEEGVGDLNDNWSIESQSPDPLTAGSLIRVIHAETKRALHSHSENNLGPEFEEFQEVTAFEGRDDNDLWIIESVQPALESAIEEPLFSVVSNDVSKAFSSPIDFRDWLANERRSFEWLQKAINQTNRGSEVLSAVLNSFREMDSALANLIAQQGSNEFESYLRALVHITRNCYNGFTVFSDDKIVSFSQNLATKNPAEAIYAFATLCGIPFNWNGPVGPILSGSWRAFTFEEGLIGRADEEIAALDQVREKANEHLASLLTSSKGASDVLASANQQAVDITEAQKTEFAKLMSDSEAKLRQLEETYDKKLSLQQSVTYWRKKSQRNWIFAGVIAAVGLILGGFIVHFLFGEVKSLFPTQTVDKPPAYWQVASLFLMTTFGIWLLRIFVKLFFSNVHLATDAGERSVMMSSYLAMLREGNALDPKDREIIIQTLFRPSQTGIVSDHGPGHIFELFASKNEK